MCDILHEFTNLYLNTKTCTQTCEYVCVREYVGMCDIQEMYIHTSRNILCVCVCVYIYMNIYIYIYLYMCYIYIYIYIYIYSGEQRTLALLPPWENENAA